MEGKSIKMLFWYIKYLLVYATSRTAVEGFIKETGSLAAALTFLD